MRIILRNDKWAVMAHWLGAERVVFTSSNVFECIRFVRGAA
jgi:hypothetical protein